MRLVTVASGEPAKIFVRGQFKRGSVGKILFTNKNGTLSTITSTTKFFDAGAEFTIPASYLELLPGTADLQVGYNNVFTTVLTASISTLTTEEQQRDARYVNESEVSKKVTIGRRVWFIGDSITSNGCIAGASGSRTAGAIVFSPLAYSGWALLQTAGKFIFGGVAATSGYNTTQIKDTHLPTVVAAAPAVCVVLAGTNDVVANNLTLTKNNLKAIYDGLEAVGTLPIACTIPPQGAAPVAFVTKLNSWIRAEARRRGIPCVDFHEILVQIVTGGFGTAFHAGDSIHPNTLGARYMGDALARALNALPVQPVAPQFVGGFDSSAMMQDPTYNVVTNHWAQAGTGAAPTLTTDATIIQWKGNKVALVAGGASNNKFLTGTLTQPVAGDRVSFLAKVDAPTVPASGKWSAYLVMNGNIICGYSEMDQTLPVGSVLAFDFTSVAAQFSAFPWTVVFSATGAATSTIRFAQASVLNLTSLEAI